jgi:hypothetical protein
MKETIWVRPPGSVLVVEAYVLELQVEPLAFGASVTTAV